MIIAMAVYGKLIPIDPGHVARLPLRHLEMVVAKHFSVVFTVRGVNDN